MVIYDRFVGPKLNLEAQMFPDVLRELFMMFDWDNSGDVSLHELRDAAARNNACHNTHGSCRVPFALHERPSCTYECL